MRRHIPRGEEGAEKVGLWRKRTSAAKEAAEKFVLAGPRLKPWLTWKREAGPPASAEG